MKTLSEKHAAEVSQARTALVAMFALSGARPHNGTVEAA
jgi:hypothetical protein